MFKQQKVVFTVSALVDVKSKQRVMEAVADIHGTTPFLTDDDVRLPFILVFNGVDTIAADFKEQKLTITGEMDIIAIAKRLKKFGKFEVASVETGEEKKEQNEGKKYWWEMAEEKPAARVEVEAEGASVVKDVEEEKTAIVPASEEKPDDSKALAIVEQAVEPSANDRDTALARVATEKRLSLIKAWEENEKVKAENKALKKMSSISAWENSKKAEVEAELKKKEEELEKKKAEHAEKVKNKIALIHKEAEEKRAIAEAKHGEEALKAEEKAAKYRATGLTPKRIFGFF
ncbi:unnamed protein product [Musa acuminata var. zebrina]